MDTWDDVVHNVRNNLSNLDRATLERYLNVPPPQYSNPSLVNEVQEIKQLIMRRLDSIPDFSNKSNIELNHYLTQFPSTHSFYKHALSELSIREITISQIPNYQMIY